jgi:hypothetical protein
MSVLPLKSSLSAVWLKSCEARSRPLRLDSLGRKAVIVTRFSENNRYRFDDPVNWFRPLKKQEQPILMALAMNASINNFQI